MRRDHPRIRHAIQQVGHALGHFVSEIDDVHVQLDRSGGVFVSLWTKRGHRRTALQARALSKKRTSR